MRVLVIGLLLSMAYACTTYTQADYDIATSLTFDPYSVTSFCEGSVCVSNTDCYTGYCYSAPNTLEFRDWLVKQGGTGPFTWGECITKSSPSCPQTTNGGLSTLAIALIAAGSAVIVGAIVGFVIWKLRNKTLQAQLAHAPMMQQYQ